MKQKETLQLIRARCAELLEQAKLRTPGAWDSRSTECVCHTETDLIVLMGHNSFPKRMIHNVAFAANAAGNFEAALISTIDAIDTLSIVHRVTDATIQDLVRQGSDRIITAWKHLLP